MAQVELDGVQFTYAGAEKPALSGTSITLRPGTVTALVGPSGCGKTTVRDTAEIGEEISRDRGRCGGAPLTRVQVTRLLCRFYDADKGRVLIDGVDVR